MEHEKTQRNDAFDRKYSTDEEKVLLLISINLTLLLIDITLSFNFFSYFAFSRARLYFLSIPQR